MKTLVPVIAILFLSAPALVAQEESPAAPTNAAPANAVEPNAAEPNGAEPNAAAKPADQPTAQEGSPETTTPAESNPPDVTGKAKELAAETQAKAEEIAGKLDESESVKQAAEGILGPIYVLAESLSFPAFHWLAFGLMAAGVVSFALQLVLGKLVVLFRGSINVREILSDLIGLTISALGLVLTTQAAAENSTFTHSPTAVLSSAAFGVVVGITLYFWGQTQEVNAVAGQRATRILPKQPKA